MQEKIPKQRPTSVYQPSAPMRFFYGTKLGRILFRPILCRPVSYLAGRYLDSRASRFLIRNFIRKNQIDTSQFEERTYTSFNDYFTRKIKPGGRTFSQDALDMCAPCDSRLSAYPIDENTGFFIKGSYYTVNDILEERETAFSFQGGTALIFRLGVQDYHRYAFFDDCEIGEEHRIRGIFHTVQPIAVERFPVFHRNTRTWTVLNTAHFGKVIYAEIGALLVGRICNNTTIRTAMRGQEKGYFAYGGSTVIVLLQQAKAEIDTIFFENTEKGLETVVKQGEIIGKGSSI